MKISKKTIGSALTLGLCSLTTAASADVFTTHFPVTGLHSTHGGNTSGSYAAATMMGAQGYSNALIPVNWDSVITSSCTSFTGSSLWPSSCNPAGMAQAVAQYTANDWITLTYANTDQASALSETLASLQIYHSPAIVPIYGQADHWVAVSQITATNNAGVWTINQVKYYDGGPYINGETDSSGNSYTDGLVAYSGNTWKNVYYKVLTAINPSCDAVGCTSDPYYNKFVLMFEPPGGPNHAPISAAYLRAPGLVPSGTMNAHTAQSLVWRSLTAAGVNADSQIWNVISGGTAAGAFLVNGVFPTGATWDYYLVPILSTASTGANSVIGFVQVSADDGSFDGVHALTTPVAFTPVSDSKAQSLAGATLHKGETLIGGALTWDSSGSAKLGKSPVHPFYEFGVMSAGHSVGTVRVSLFDGVVVRD